MGRQRDIASLLGFDLQRLKRLVRDRQDQYWRKNMNIGNKPRAIVCPFGAMRAVHGRIQSLCNRVAQPVYLHSPRRGHTAAGNAAIHNTSRVIAKLDIRQFYPSTTDEHVFRFFRYRLDMTDDVAGLMTKLCSVDGRLPFGSPLSPVLCTLVHRDLFDRIHLYCRTAGLNMTLWVDDITLSGDDVPDVVLQTIKGFIHNKGLRYHKVQRRLRISGAVVTGHYLHRKGVAAANKHHLGVRDALAQLDATTDPVLRLKLVRSMIGKTDHARRIYLPSSPVRKRLDQRRDWLHVERRRLQRLSFTTHPTKPQSVGDITRSDPPWGRLSDDIHSQYLSALNSALSDVGPQSS